MLHKYIHEIRDPVHVFIRLNSDERRVLDSAPFQRLRHIHQLALSYLVYPGATHKRFEHALGTMELAVRVFDTITDPRNVHHQIRSLIPEISQPPEGIGYWRRVLRMAALCHDIGHLPFSHAAEKELLPDGWDHERISVEIIKSDEMRDIWESMTPPLRAEHVARLAVGQKVLVDEEYSDWEAILSEIIVGNAFGVDRIDYLLRDSIHTGVGYGKFDHHRLLDTLRILPNQDSDEPILGIESGGVHSAQALLIARYFMYAQVYFHPVRRMYDKHLIDFLTEWLPQGTFPISSDGIQQYTDVEVMNGIRETAKDSSANGYDPAMRIIDRQHYKRVYSRVSGDVERHLTPGRIVFESLCERYGRNNVYHDFYEEKDRVNDIRVLSSDDRVFSESEMLESIPQLTVDCVYINPAREAEAVDWLKTERENILDRAPQEEE
ncbi:MAG: HD domain-containing protein [Chloroflexi bacterium]|nr:HD domain-containing protein [Chloroflexota bacterium]